jgi:hypothetical protein
MPRPKFEPSAEQRRLVERMAALGTPETEIAKNVGPEGIDPKTLRKHFRRELSTGATKATTRVAETLYQMATSGTCPAASIFWMKCRGGWRENRELGPSGPAVVPGEGVTHAELDKQITDELDRIEAAGNAAIVPGDPDAGKETAPGVHVEGLEGET